MGTVLRMLSADEHSAQLCSDYWLSVADRKFVYSISELCARYNVSQQELLRRVQAASVFYDEEACCGACSAPDPYRHRADYHRRRTIDRAWVCERCLAENPEHPRVPPSHDGTLVEHLRAALRARRAEPRSLQSLPLASKVVLTAVLRGASAPVLPLLEPLGTWRRPLSPTPEFDRTVMGMLVADGVACVAPLSRPGAARLASGEAQYDVERVHWILPFVTPPATGADVLTALERSLASPVLAESSRRGLDALRAGCALHECFQHLRASFDEYELSPPVLERFRVPLERALTHLTVGRVRTIISDAARRGGAAVQAASISRDAVAAVVSREIDRCAERALNDLLHLPETRPDSRAEVSQLVLLLQQLDRLDMAERTALGQRASDGRRAREQPERIKFRLATVGPRATRVYVHGWQPEPRSPAPATSGVQAAQAAQAATVARAATAPSTRVPMPPRPVPGPWTTRYATDDLLARCRATREESAERRAALRHVLEESRAVLEQARVARAG